MSVKHKAILCLRLNKEEGSLYDFPPEERLPMSEFLSHLWKRAVKEGKANYGIEIKEGDLKKIGDMKVDNPDTKAIVAKAKQDVDDNKATFYVKPENERAFEAFAASSTGVSKLFMLIDHNSAKELNYLKPIRIDVTTLDELPVVLWTLK